MVIKEYKITIIIILYQKNCPQLLRIKEVVAYTNNKSEFIQSDSAFVVRFLDIVISLVSLVSKSEILGLYLASAAQASLVLRLSKHPKTDWLDYESNYN